MSPAERGLRMRLVAAARRLATLGLNHGKSGNVSVRIAGGFIITPSGKSYEALAPGDLVAVEGGEPRGNGKPSSEWRLHRDIYARRSEAAAIVHTHSSFATTLASLRRPIPAVHYEVGFAGGEDIRCASYATFGTQELSDNALAALEGRSACLLANHGVVTFAATVEQAVVLAEKVEDLAGIYWQALQVGEPVVLDGAEMARVIEKLKTYGR
jgi:L-fuculose-phosphate aldolase